MDTHTSERRLHPLMVAAAISIIIFCGVGVAAISGLIPQVYGSKSNAEPVATVSGTAAETPATVTEKQVASEAAKEPVAESTAPPKPHRATHRVAEAPAYQAPACYDCGTVVAVNAVAVPGNTSGVGAVGGAVVGGVVGHQFGNGHGKQAMTALGAIGGALAGNAVEKSQRQNTRYDVVVRMQDGGTRTISASTPPPFSSGDRVRIAPDGSLLHAN